MRYDKIHDLRESALSSRRHVECVDCHNPHSIENIQSEPPLASGMIRNVSGVTASGSETRNIEFEYELCFKCHGDNPDRVPSAITRVITQTNTRLEFQPDNPSFHPVTSVGINENVPSLRTPLTVGDMIRCTDCHNSDVNSSVKGPHGSVFAPILAYNYETADFTVESEAAYELCYRCHSRNSILENQSFPQHRLHLDEDIPCSACHDAHGISSVQGNETNNSHLINFDVRIVEKDPSSGLLEFQDNGVFQGQCYLACHGVSHSPETY
jgi:hypothetical protein